MVSELENNIYIDQLTGLPNFFEFINIDTVSIFGESGSVIIFDIGNFKMINDIYGLDFGDLCLKCFANVVVHVFEQHNNVNIFRTGGDEFTIILPKFLPGDAEKAADLIEKSYIEEMNECNSDININVHKLIINYSNPITSINEYYHILFIRLYNQNEEKLSYKQWPGQIIHNFIQRIRETLYFSNEVYNLALSDDVSSLPNHRAALIYLNKLISKSQNDNKQFSLLFIDGDDLKRYNKISYQTGNKMIKELSMIISKNVRKNDEVFRWLSGDEFIVVFDDTNYKNALGLAERIRIAVERETKNWAYPVTVSIGVCNFPNDGQSVDVIINKAERANQLAKKTGKNKVVKWDFTIEA